MHIRLNGEDREIDPCSIGDLLRTLGVHPDGTAVAVNGEVVPRASHPLRPIHEGDIIEVIRAVGGG